MVIRCLMSCTESAIAISSQAVTRELRFVRRQNGKWAFTSSVKSKPHLMFTNTFPERETVVVR